MKKPKQIFTFWEPKEKIPPYLQLCMKTWKKYLPDYEIIILDYDSLDKWLGKNHYCYDLYMSYSLPQQADAIRAALLEKYGGLWMDCDTILTSDKIRNLLENDAEVIMIGKDIGFIHSIKNARVIKKWHRLIKRNLILCFLYKNFSFIRNFMNLFFPQYAGYIKDEHWGFLGNIIINPIIEKINSKYYLGLDINKLNIMPERNYYKNSSENNIKKYEDFFFNNNLVDFALKKNSGLICLHNSWTPKKYKEMDKKTFLEQDCTLTNILKNILDIS